jgi:hypothetical protein
MVETPTGSTVAYEAPALVDLGVFQELTLSGGCNKDLGGSDGFTFQNQQVSCTST